jgi:hypothetical protein
MCPVSWVILRICLKYKKGIVLEQAMKNEYVRYGYLQKMGQIQIICLNADS